jgi:hypothetical protein
MIYHKRRNSRRILVWNVKWWVFQIGGIQFECQAVFSCWDLPDEMRFADMTIPHFPVRQHTQMCTQIFIRNWEGDYCNHRKGVTAVYREGHVIETIIIPGIAVQAKDATGCGDVFSSAFLRFYLQDAQIKPALVYANQVAATKCQTNADDLH